MSDTPTQPAGPEAPEVPEAPPLPWADVQPEHLRMLRLAPLPTDRNTGARPLRFVQFGHATRHSKDLSLLRMTITLPGRQFRKFGIAGSGKLVLDNLDQGDLKYNTDFRSVYASILQDWMGTPSKPILGQQFKTMPIVKA